MDCDDPPPSSDNDQEKLTATVTPVSPDTQDAAVYAKPEEPPVEESPDLLDEISPEAAAFCEDPNLMCYKLYELAIESFESNDFTKFKAFCLGI